MTAYYPTSIKNDYSLKVDFSDTILAIHVNSLQEEVSAIESNLGTYIRVSSGWTGTFDKTISLWDSLKDRLANIEYGLNKAMPDGGASGQVLIKNSSSNYDVSWGTVAAALPTQSGNNGKFLTTNGSTASWATVSEGTPGETISSFLLIGA